MQSAESIYAVDEVMGPLLARALASPEWERLPAGLSRKHETWGVDILKYRAGRRLSLRVTIPRRRKPGSPPTRFILKIWYNRRGRRIYDLLDYLNAQLRARPAVPLIIPRPLFYDEAAHAMAYEEITGEPVTRALRRGASRDIVLRIAEALANFHNLMPPPLADRSPEDEAASVESLFSTFNRGSNSITRRLRSLLDRLRRSMPRAANSAELLHRDLYDQQILIRPGDARLAFIDLDDMARGDALLDAGNFLAHLHLMGHWQKRPDKLARLRRRFLRRWSRLRTRPEDDLEEKARWFEAVALARLAAMQAQRGTPELAIHIVDQAETLMKPSLIKSPAKTKPRR